MILESHQYVVRNRKNGGKNVRLNIFQSKHTNEPADRKDRLEKQRKFCSIFKVSVIVVGTVGRRSV